MRNGFIITLLLFTLVQYGHAQGYNLNPLSENWIGWSIGNSKKDFDIKVPVQEQVGGVIRTNDNSTVRIGSPSRTNRTTQRNHYSSPSAVNERIDAWRADMKARAKAREMRIETENARDRERGLHDYLNRTSGFHQAYAARDAWMITEGTRYLQDNYHAMDMADIPTRGETQPKISVLNTKDMANLLKEKIEEKDKPIIFVSEKDRKRIWSLDNMTDQIPITEDTEMVKSQVDAFANAHNESNIFNLPGNNKAIMKEPTVLVNHQEVPIDSLDIFTLPRYGLVGVWGDSLIVFKDKEFGTIAWLDKGIYSNVVPCGNKLIGKCKSSIYIVGEQEAIFLLDFDTSDYYLYAHDDKSVYLLFRYEGLSTIIKVDVESNIHTEIVRIPQSIWSIASNGSVMFALVENTILTIDDKGMPKKIFDTDECINDIVFFSEGLLIGTDERIIQVKSAKNVTAFYDKGVKRLWFDGKNVYAQNEENDLLFFK